MRINFSNYSTFERKLMDTILNMSWEQLKDLWNCIKKGNAQGWDSGKALEYFFIRVFDLEGAEVAYPYTNKVINSTEQIDGFVFVKDLGVGFIVECKDWNSSISFDEIAKLHGRLMYRMPSTYGIFVSRFGFTQSATELIYVMHPHNVLLWSFDDIDECLLEHKFISALKYKFQYAMMTTNTNVNVVNGLNI